MSKSSVTITVEFEDERQAAYAHMFLGRCGFSDFLEKTEPHLGKERCQERAYLIRNAINRIERALEAARVPSRWYDAGDA
jgi:hypothetical protein